LGRYKIIRLDYLSDDISDVWSIMLSTSAKINEIQDVLLFVEDNCLVTKLSDQDLLGTTNLIEDQKDDDDISILEYIEHPQISLIDSKTENSEKIRNEDLSKNTYSNNDYKQTTSYKRISVDSSKLDHLMYLVSELITVNSQLI